jgi:hypothetical protein
MINIPKNFVKRSVMSDILWASRNVKISFCSHLSSVNLDFDWINIIIAPVLRHISPKRLRWGLSERQPMTLGFVRLTYDRILIKLTIFYDYHSRCCKFIFNEQAHKIVKYTGGFTRTDNSKHLWYEKNSILLLLSLIKFYFTKNTGSLFWKYKRVKNVHISR